MSVPWHLCFDFQLMNGLLSHHSLWWHQGPNVLSLHYHWKIWGRRKWSFSPSPMITLLGVHRVYEVAECHCRGTGFASFMASLVPSHMGTGTMWGASYTESLVRCALANPNNPALSSDKAGLFGNNGRLISENGWLNWFCGTAAKRQLISRDIIKIGKW